MSDNKLKKFSRRLRNDSTLAEILLWQRIKNRQLGGYRFLRQKVIGGYIVDFYCHELKLVIEIDGSTHFDRHDSDVQRKEKIESLGYSVLCFGDWQAKSNLTGVVMEIESWINENRRA